MNRVDDIKFKKLKRVSPSQFFSIKNCAYKVLLAEAFDKKPLLPISPNSYFGRVAHKILEMISKQEIRTKEDFEIAFDSEIRDMESILIQDGYSFFVPLQMNIRNFGMKKIQLKKHLRFENDRHKLSTPTRYITEKWLESIDKLIGGKIDLVIETAEEIEIIDFKTGEIKENFVDDEGESVLVIKDEYQDQLKLYAYLFFENAGRFPTKLSLVDLARQKFSIDFSLDECKLIFEEAKKSLLRINDSVDSHEFAANPNETNCKFCLYRPACSFYLKWCKTTCMPNDVSGTINNVVKYGNGNVTLSLNMENLKVSITGFNETEFEYFNGNLNKQINLFNLKKEATDLVYSATKTTKIYES